MLLKFYHIFTCRYVESRLSWSLIFMSTDCVSLRHTNSCLQTQDMETEECHWEVMKPSGQLFSSDVVQWMRAHQNCKNRLHPNPLTEPLLSKWLSGTWDYRKAQKSLDTRGTLSNIDCQVTFATPGIYCELIIFSGFWYYNNKNNNRYFSAARRSVAKVGTINFIVSPCIFQFNNW